MKDSPLGRLIKHPVDPADAALKLEAVKREFGNVLDVDAAEEMALALSPFVDVRPLCYYSRLTFNSALKLFSENVAETFAALETHSEHVSKALYSVFQKTDAWSVEASQMLSNPADVLAFDRTWNPEYQRYAEHAFNHFTRLPLELLQQKMNKNFQALELANRASKLVELGYPDLAEGFSATVRNAISHGGIYFGDGTIRYVSSKSADELYPYQFIAKLDALADTCSGFAAAVLAFLCIHHEEAAIFGLHRLPAAVRFLLIRGLCNHPGFRIEQMIEASLGGKHLNLYSHSQTRSRTVHLFEALHAAVQVYRCGGEYAVITISITCGATVPAYLIVNGEGLANALVDGTPDAALKDVIQSDLLWHDTWRFGRWLYIAKTFVSSHMRMTQVSIRKKLFQQGHSLWRERYVIRAVDNKSAGNLRRVVAEVVVRDLHDLNVDCLRGIIRHAARTLRKKWVVGKDFGHFRFVRLPPAYVVIRLHYGDARVRQLQRRNSAEAGLLLRAEWISIRHRKKPIWVAKPHEFLGHIRVCWVVGKDAYENGESSQ